MDDPSPGPFLDTSGNGRHLPVTAADWVFQKPAIPPRSNFAAGRAINTGRGPSYAHATWMASPHFAIEFNAIPPPTASSATNLIAKYAATGFGNHEWGIQKTTGGGINFAVWLSTGAAAGAQVPMTVHLDQPHHWICSFDGLAVRVWMDGTLAASSPLVGSRRIGTTIPLFIGGPRNPTAQAGYWTGSVSNIRYHSIPIVPPTSGGLRHIGLGRGARVIS